jgi:hypothetical protein
MLAIAGTFLALTEFRQPAVTLFNLNRVQKGMTWTEVEGILGDNHNLRGMGRPWAFTEVWIGTSGERAFVTFRLDRNTDELKVVGTKWQSAWMANLETILDLTR